MKKIGIVVVVVVVAAVLAAGYFSWQKMASREYALEEVLPEKPLLYLHVKDIEKNLDKFSQSKLYQNLTAIDFDKLLSLLGASAPEKEIFKKFSQQASVEEIRRALLPFFGQETALAVYPVEFDSFSSEAINRMFSSIVVVTRLKPQAEFVEFLHGILGSGTKELKVEKKIVHGHTLNLVKSADGSVNVGYVRINDLLVMGWGDNAARMCLQAIRKNGRTLASDAGFLQVRQRFLENSSLTGFANFDLLATLLKDKIMSLPAKGARKMPAQLSFSDFKQLQGFLYAGYSARFEQGIESKMDVHFDKTALHPDIRPMYECAVKENRSLNFVPPDVLVYQWGGCYDFAYYWRQVHDRMKKSALDPKSVASPGETIASLENAMGLSLEDDILPVLGQEAGGFLKDVKVTAELPVPQLLLFLEVTDPAKAGQIIDTLLSKQSVVQPQTENYQGHVIKYIPFPMVEGLELAYGFAGNYLLIATQRDLFKASVDLAGQSGQNISGAADFQSAGIGLTDKSNSLFFVRIAPVLQKLGELTAWAGEWSQQQAKQHEAFQEGQEKYLAEVRADISRQEKQLQELKAQPPLDTSAVTTDGQTAADLTRRITETEEIIASAREKEEQLTRMLTVLGKQAAPVEPKPKVNADVVNLLTEAWQPLKTFAARVTINDDVLEMRMMLDLE